MVDTTGLNRVDPCESGHGPDTLLTLGPGSQGHTMGHGSDEPTNVIVPRGDGHL